MTTDAGHPRRVVRVERKVTVVTYALAENYVTAVHDEQGSKTGTVPMTDSQILDAELAMSAEDSFNSLIEAGSVADEADIDQSCKVTFVSEDDLPPEIRGRVV